MKPYKISIVIPTKDRPLSLRHLLNSIFKCNDLFDELIVVDSTANNSDRKTNRRLVERLGGKYYYESGKGVSIARNTGIRKSTGEILVFADDDFIVTKGWIRNIIRDYGDRNVVCCTGRMLSYRDDDVSKLYERTMSFDRGYRRLVFTKKDISPTRLLRAVSSIGNKRLFEKTPVPWAVGYGFYSFRTWIFDKIGYFDINLGRGTPYMGGEDPDIFYRILKGNYKIIYEPAAIIYHDHRQSFDEVLKDAYSSGISDKALTTKYYSKDLYMSLCLLGAFFLHAFSFAKATLRSDHQLKDLIFAELCGFLSGQKYSHSVEFG